MVTLEREREFIGTNMDVKLIAKLRQVEVTIQGAVTQ